MSGLVRVDMRDATALAALAGGAARPIAVVTLTRPGKRNAMTPAMFDELDAALARTADAAGLVLAGEGPVFCGGFDLALCHERPETTGVLLGRLSAAIAALARRDTPVVIAAHGAAIAGGAALLSAADVVVADRGVRVGYPVLRLGLSPAVSFPFMRVAAGRGGIGGAGAVRERLLDTGLLSGPEALAAGFVHELVDTPAECGPRALAVCEALAAKPAHAFAATKRLIRKLADGSASNARHVDRLARDARAALALSLATADTDECRSRIAAALNTR